MVKPPADGNQPDADVASQVKLLSAELARMREAFEGHVKESSARLDAAIKASETAAKDAAAALEGVGDAIKAAQAATDAAGSAVKAAEAANSAADGATKAAKAAETKAADADKRAAAAEAKADEMAEELATNTGEITELREALGNSKPAAPAAPGKLPDFLAIRVRQTEFDPIINRVLAEFRAEQNRNVDIARFSKELVERGLATSIGKVSQTLSRSRISETRRNILAAAYPALLKNQLGNPLKARLAKDTAGLAQNLLAELELVLEDFAEGVVEASEKSLSLDLDAGARKALLARVRESI
jgi:chemotaxis protein histidine kinase CheA